MVLRYAQQSGNGNVICVGCGRVLEHEFTELDHIRPKSEGGPNTIDNRILLCSPCNGAKGNSLTLSGLKRRNSAARPNRWMKDERSATDALKRVQNTVRVIVHDFESQPAKDLVNGARLERL